LCPPIAVTDSTCSRPSIPINIEILLNDFDRDNELDPGSVTLFDQSHAPSQFLYREDGAYVSVFPSDGDLSTMSFSYSICDNTSLLDGGALCDTGIVVIEILDDCIGPVLLSRAYPALRVTHFQNRIRLFWSEVETAPAELWLERAYENGLFYPLYKWINGESVNELEDMEASLLAGRWRYRWRLGDQSPGAAVEVVVRKQTNRQEMLVLAREAGRPLVITLHAENPGEIVLVDLMGREVYTQAAQAGVQTLEIPAQIMAQQAGYWVVYWRSMGWQEAAKLRPVIGQ
ncbi:MAG: hypothetical protein NWR72_07250, partial [Bacteroidia bacterium]|nr:hypothetical protein [Bacteroidia bacterium]